MDPEDKSSSHVQSGVDFSRVSEAPADEQQRAEVPRDTDHDFLVKGSALPGATDAAKVGHDEVHTADGT
jgi:hypothetical protein